jgi:hypothetical protein
MRPQVKDDLGEEGKSLIMSELGKRWKELKEDVNRAEELAEYTKMAADDKSRYEDEKENGKSTEVEVVEKPKKKAKAEVEEDETDADEKQAKKETKEKKPKTGYAYFCNLNRNGVKTDNPEMKEQDITRELARLWKELNKHEQKEWSDSAAEL